MIGATDAYKDRFYLKYYTALSSHIYSTEYLISLVETTLSGKMHCVYRIFKN